MLHMYKLLLVLKVSFCKQILSYYFFSVNNKVKISEVATKIHLKPPPCHPNHRKCTLASESPLSCLQNVVCESLQQRFLVMKIGKDQNPPKSTFLQKAILKKKNIKNIHVNASKRIKTCLKAF